MEKMTVNDDLTVTGKVTPDDLQKAAQDGFKSVLNLRGPDEDGFLTDEQKVAEAAGMQYVNIPVKKDAINDALTDKVLAEIDRLPKPALIHCASGMRAGAMTLMHVATRHGMSAKDAMAKAKSLGFDCDSEPELKAYFEQYVDSHQKGG